MSSYDFLHLHDDLSPKTNVIARYIQIFLIVIFKSFTGKFRLRICQRSYSVILHVRYPGLGCMQF